MDYKTEKKLRFSYNDKLFDLLKFNEFLADKKFIRRLATNKSQMLFGYLKDIRFYRKFINECEKRYPSFDIENIRKNCIIVEDFSNEKLYIYIKDKFDIKTLEEIKNMHFDVAIMNPPYGNKKQGIPADLHNQIYNCICEKCKKTVCLMPVNKYQTFHDLTTVLNETKNNTKNLEIIAAKDAGTILNIAIPNDLGIFYNFGNNNVDWNSLIYKNIPKANNIIEKIKNNFVLSIKDYVKEQTKTKHFCKISENHGNPGKKDEFDLVSPDFEKFVYNAESGSQSFNVYFKTKNECLNFHNSLLTIFMKFYRKFEKDGIHIYFKYYPYMSDYTKPWTNERFCEYFNITGYISDTEAEKGSEWETIIKTMEDYE